MIKCYCTLTTQYIYIQLESNLINKNFVECLSLPVSDKSYLTLISLKALAAINDILLTLKLKSNVENVEISIVFKFCFISNCRL